jgi:hypothetical protein
MENDELAFRQMRIGWLWQKYVACFFEAHGLPVDLPEFALRESRKHIADFADERDLTVAGHRIEVKSRDLHFTTFPVSFPWARPFVDTVNSYDYYKVKPIAYVFVSQKTGALLATRGGQDECDEWWEKQEKYDKVRGIKDTFYVTSKTRLTPIGPLLDRLRKEL